MWGQLLKTGYQNSQLAHQAERFACLYTSHVANLLYYSPDKSYRFVLLFSCTCRAFIFMHASCFYFHALAVQVLPNYLRHCTPSYVHRARMDVMAHEEEPWFDLDQGDDEDVLLPSNGNGAAELATQL